MRSRGHLALAISCHARRRSRTWLASAGLLGGQGAPPRRPQLGELTDAGTERAAVQTLLGGRTTLRRLVIVTFARLTLAIGLAACAAFDEAADADHLDATRSFEFSFREGDARGFFAVFRDIPKRIFDEYVRRKEQGLSLGPVAPLTSLDVAADDTHWLLHDGVMAMPDELEGSGFLLQGNNHSDDLDMFLVRELGPEDGILPDTRYTVRFDRLALAGDVPHGALGVGGSPELTIRGIAASIDPRGFEVDASDHVRHPGGLGSDPGIRLATNAICSLEPADVTTTMPACPDDVDDIEFSRIDVEPGVGDSVTSDAEGRIWVMVGGHSGFESFSGIYYTNVDVTVEPEPG